jgi:hypothetical protein
VRLSEKTIELNFCAQATSAYSGGAFWFGLTQRQEARAGFDVAARLGGRLLLLQFKASNRISPRGGRRFLVHHDQLEDLRIRANPSKMRSVFYVFPEVGDTSDLSTGHVDLLSRSWLLDVATLPAIGVPTRRDGRPRKNRTHYADLQPPRLTLHSRPIELSVIRADSFFRGGAEGSDGLDISDLRSELQGRRPASRPFSRGAVGLVLP